MRFVIRDVRESVAGVLPEMGIGGGDHGVAQPFRQMLRIGLAKRDVAPPRIVRRKCEQHVLAGPVIDAGGLEQEPIRRVEQLGQELYGWEIAREIDVGYCRGENARGDEQRSKDAHRQQAAAFAGRTRVLAGKPSLAAGAQDGQGGRHGDKYTGKQAERKTGKVEGEWWVSGEKCNFVFLFQGYVTHSV